MLVRSLARGLPRGLPRPIASDGVNIVLTERIVTPDFSSSAGWTAGAGWVIAAGQAVGTTPAGSLTATLNAPIGGLKAFTLSFDIVSNPDSDTIQFLLFSALISQELAQAFSVGTHVIHGVTEGFAPYTELRINDLDLAGVVVLDNVSLKAQV